MSYPIIIENENSLIETIKELFTRNNGMVGAEILKDQMNIRNIVKETSKQAVMQMLLQTGYFPPRMTLAKCQRIGRRTRVDNAIKAGELKAITSGSNRLIETDDFFSWLSKDQLK